MGLARAGVVEELPGAASEADAEDLLKTPLTTQISPALPRTTVMFLAVEHDFVHGPAPLSPSRSIEDALARPKDGEMRQVP